MVSNGILAGSRRLDSRSLTHLAHDVDFEFVGRRNLYLLHGYSE